MKRILILVHRHGSFGDQPYYLREIAGLWTREGHEVVVAAGPEQAVDADLAFNHVDLTVTPEDHLDILQRYPKAVNGRVADISKRRVSRGLLRRGEAWDGPVIIKADRNNGGHSEALLAKRGLHPDKFYVPAYQVVDSAADVDDAVWDHPLLVVERYQAEIVDGHYTKRFWMFLGDRGLGFRYFSRHPVVKGANIVRREPLGEPPEDLLRIRAELGFEFGSFDYAVADGRAVVYDANRTPSWGRTLPRETALVRAGVLAEGLRSLL